MTQDLSAYTRAAFLQPGAKTEMVARFSTVAGERGSPDTWRDPRGFALKFYTSEGNFDMVGNNTPVFFVRDPMKFQNFIRSQKRMAANNLRDHHMQWDFWTLSPESAHQVTYLMGDRGIPRRRGDERLLRPHLQLAQRRRRTVLGQIPFQNRPGHRHPDRRTPIGWPVRTVTTTRGICSPRSRKAISRAGRCTCRSCRSRMPRPIASTRST